MSLLSLLLLLVQAVAPPAAPKPQIPANKTPTTVTSAPQAPANKTPATVTAAPQVPANKTPATVTAAPQVPANKTPATVVPSPDPASSQFTSATGLLLVTIKATGIADYELAIQTVQEALAKSTDPAHVAAAKGWRVFKALEFDAKANAIYVHMMIPAVPGFDYRPSLLLDQLVTDLAPDMFLRYQDAFAAPPTKLNLDEFAHMAVKPVPKPDPTKPDPTKLDPTKKPDPPKKPGS